MKELRFEYLLSKIDLLAKSLVFEFALLISKSKHPHSLEVISTFGSNFINGSIDGIVMIELKQYLFRLNSELDKVKAYDPTFSRFSDHLIRPNSILSTMTIIGPMDSWFWEEIDKLLAKDDKFYEEFIEAFENIANLTNRIRKNKMPDHIHMLLILEKVGNQDSLPFCVIDEKGRLVSVGQFSHKQDDMSALVSTTSTIKTLVISPLLMGPWLLTGEPKALNLIKSILPSGDHVKQQLFTIEFHFFKELRKHFKVLNVRLDHEYHISRAYHMARTMTL